MCTLSFWWVGGWQRLSCSRLNTNYQMLHNTLFLFRQTCWKVFMFTDSYMNPPWCKYASPLRETLDPEALWHSGLISAWALDPAVLENMISASILLPLFDVSFELWLAHYSPFIPCLSILNQSGRTCLSSTTSVGPWSCRIVDSLCMLVLVMTEKNVTYSCKEKWLIYQKVFTDCCTVVDGV